MKISKKYNNRYRMEKDIELMSFNGWKVCKIRESKSKTLGCSGCCIIPFPLLWYSKDYEVDFEKEKDDEKVPLEQEYDATKKPSKV